MSALVMGTLVFGSGYLYNKKLDEVEKKYLSHLTDHELVNFNLYFMQFTTHLMY